MDSKVVKCTNCKRKEKNGGKKFETHIYCGGGLITIFTTQKEEL